MPCTRGTAVSLSISQFIATVIVLVYVPEKRPLFLYSTSLSYLDALSSYNQSSYTMWFAHDDARTSTAVNPYLANLGDSSIASSHPAVISHTNRAASHFSTTYIMVVVAFALFMVPSFLGAVFCFMSTRLTDSGEVSLDALYGEHGVKNAIGWEVCFWTLVCAQHAVVQCVLCSPVHVVAVIGTSFALTVLLLAFCVLAVNAEGDSPSRRFEGPVFILVCLLYLFVVTQTKVVVSRQFTFLLWFLHVATNALLVFGHLAETPVSCTTVFNCRWTYVVISCWFNIGLYVAY